MGSDGCTILVPSPNFGCLGSESSRQDVEAAASHEVPDAADKRVRKIFPFLVVDFLD